MRSPWTTSTASSRRVCTPGSRALASAVKLIAPLSVTQADPEVADGRDDVGVERDVLGPTHDLRQGNPGDGGPVEPDHDPEAAIGDCPHGRRTEAEREQPVVGRRRAPPLKMAQHQCTDLLAGAFLNGAGDLTPDATQSIQCARAPALEQDDVTVLRAGPLCGDDDAEAAPHRFPVPDLVAHLLDVERDLGQQDHVGAADAPLDSA